MRGRSESGLNSVEFHILLAITDEDRHGYGIIQEVERHSQGSTLLGPGTLYGAIKRLMAAGFIDESKIRPKDADVRRTCYYHLTTKGRAAATQHAEVLSTLLQAAAGKQLISLAMISG
jgi:DNA-binding PadR family transcriptional regulator